MIEEVTIIRADSDTARLATFSTESIKSGSRFSPGIPTVICKPLQFNRFITQDDFDRFLKRYQRIDI
jgi:hypothetical protein